MKNVELVLASNSPRRRQLLTWLGWQPVLLAAQIDETPLPAETPQVYTLRLAVEKARLAARLRSEAGDPGSPMRTLLLAADTTVADGDDLLGKPADAAEARQMLARLRGRTHQVVTAAVLLDPSTQQMEAEICVTQVPMRSYSDAEIQAYVESGDPLDKAGAYAIQHAGFHPVEHFGGCFASVMGLPMCHLIRAARRLGWQAADGASAVCRQHLDYECEIYPAVLRGEQAG